MTATYEIAVSGGLSWALEGTDMDMPLASALWAPECRGFYGAPGYTVPMLRGAVGRGELGCVRRGRLVLVTR
jgi:hypothetical protein